MGSTLIRGGKLAASRLDEPVRADLRVRDGLVVEVGTLTAQPGDSVVDAGDRIVLPGLIDAHSHLDAAVFEDEAQLATLRQGVTTVVTGQDGVSFAPGSGAYATGYFGPLNGRHPRYRGGGVSELLRSHDLTSRLNVAYLVPLGTVRHEVMGMDPRPADETQVARMRGLVAEGLAEGAVGVSTGLDYVPGVHASTAELTAICRTVAEVDAVHVSHMRGGYEERAKVGTDELARIATDSGVRSHISHYHGDPTLLCGLVDDLHRQGLAVTYDSYFYLRGFTLVAMPLLPTDLLTAGNDDVVARLRDPAVRADLVENWFPHLEQTSALGAGWAAQMTVAHAPGRPEVVGLTLARAARARGADPREFVLDLLADTALQATSVMEPRTVRSPDAMVGLFTHEAMVGGSDGIVIGEHPHPRAFGNFARYLRQLVVERGAWSWGDAAWHLSEHTAVIMGLDRSAGAVAGRGSLRPGMAADLVLVDPVRVGDLASYDQPRLLSEGIDDVWVGGEQVLRDGRLTEALPGRGLRRGATGEQPAL